MKNINIKDLLNKAKDKNICVIGDVMLDQYLIGKVTRISPEAPVQVFETTESEPKLGGAANVSLNLKTLGANPLLVGIIGKDSDSEILKKALLLNNQKIDGLIVEETRPTTCKTRVIADSHHLIRIDSESKKDISVKARNKILEFLNKNAKKLDIIILQDYNKGVLTKGLIKSIIEFSKKNKKKLLVDPKFYNFFEYKDVFLFKPNRKEIEDAFGYKAKDLKELKGLAKDLIKRINCNYLVLTLGENGIMIFENSINGIKESSIKTIARKVADVSGAGDTVISTIAVFLSVGASVEQAVLIANYAAGLVVEEVGIVPIHKDKLIKHFQKHLNNK